MPSELILSYLAIPLGFWLLVWSADRFVDGASALARNLGVPPLIIGLTIVGFATSAPEMLISAFAALDGNSGLAVGNALGSNITNIALILGATALLYPIAMHSGVLQKEFPVLVGIMLIGSYLMWDGHLSRNEGIGLFVGLFVLMGWIAWQGLSNPEDPLAKEMLNDPPPPMATGRAVMWLIVGLAILLASSRLLVWSSVNIALSWGVSDLVIGLSIVALGTSLPELAATMSSAKRGEHDIAVGNVIGSNMFNILGVLGIAAMLSPTTVESDVLTRDIPVMFAVAAALYALSYIGHWRKPLLKRWNGAVLLVIYIAYQFSLFYMAA
ncbi:MAG: calcium/sodium antiporter [Pseudomonadota bacterium]